MRNYLICCSKKWFSKDFPYKKLKNTSFFYISKKEDLTVEYLKKINPLSIFFTHWHWLVPANIIENYDCILFHPSPLPFGRGGSPIQNMIFRGFKSTPLCALKMSSELDAGPIYKKIEISLEGDLKNIFSRIKVASEKIILELITSKLKPKPQIGKPEYFIRRKPEQSEIKTKEGLISIYDKIRALDGLDYPRAFINYGNKKFEFSNAKIKDNHITARVKIKIKE